MPDWNTGVIIAKFSVNFAVTSFWHENFNNREDNFQSIAICSKNDIDIRSRSKFCGASYITFVKSTFDSNIIKLLVLCKNNSLPLT